MATQREVEEVRSTEERGKFNREEWKGRQVEKQEV